MLTKIDILEIQTNKVYLVQRKMDPKVVKHKCSYRDISIGTHFKIETYSLPTYPSYHTYAYKLGMGKPKLTINLM